MTTKQYRPWSPDHPWLLPPSPRDWLPPEHLVHFVLDVAGELDLSEIETAIQAKDPRGTQPFHPRMMVALLLYGYATGTFSSRRLARATYDDVAVRYLCGEQHPHFATIADFRRNHLSALSGLFRQVVRLCREAGLASLGHVSIDGTKVQANASKHSAMSYDRMTQEEKRLEQEIADLLARAEAVDAQEDVEQGAGSDSMSLPEEMKLRQDRLAKIRAARAALEKEARQARAAELQEQAAAHRERAAAAEDDEERARAEALAARREAMAAELGAEATTSTAAAAEDGAEPSDGSGDDPPDAPPPTSSSLPKHRVKHRADGTPDDRAQRNFTDPDSRIMKSEDGYEQAYNAQAVVDADHQIIVAIGLSNQAPDVEYLRPVVGEVADTCGEKPKKLSADAGFWSRENAAWCEEQGIDAYIAVRREKHGPPVAAGPPGAEPATSDPPPKPPDPASKEMMQKKLQTAEGRAVYRLRKTIPEPVFGQIKEARGFRRFLLRGMDKVRDEWALVCTAHNLLKLYRYGPRAAATG